MVVDFEKNLEFLFGHLSFELVNSISTLENKLGYPLAGEISLEAGRSAIVLEGVSASDPYAAISRIDLIVRFPKAFQVVYPAKEAINFSDLLYVSNRKSRSITRVRQNELASTTSSHTSMLPVSKDRLSSFSRYLWAGAVNDDSESFFRIKRSLDTAAQALDTVNPQTQLITLWSALEAILPEPTKDEKSVIRITHFVEQAVPPIVARYLRGKFRIFCNDLPRHVHTDIASVLPSELVEMEEAARLAFILAFRRDLSIKISNMVCESPIVLNRMFNLQKILDDPSLAKRKMERHELRVKWQIYRIYRERNLIVHSGKSSPYVSTLAENLMLYYRLIVRAMHEAHGSFGTHSPSLALILLKKRYERRLDNLTRVSKESNLNLRKRDLINCIFED